MNFWVCMDSEMYFPMKAVKVSVFNLFPVWQNPRLIFFNRMMNKILRWFYVPMALMFFMLGTFFIILVAWLLYVLNERAVSLILMGTFSVFLLQELLTWEVSAVPRESVFLLRTTVSTWHLQLHMNLGTSKNLSFCFFLYWCHCSILLFKTIHVKLPVWHVCYDFLNLADR